MSLTDVLECAGVVIAGVGFGAGFYALAKGSINYFHKNGIVSDEDLDGTIYDSTKSTYKHLD